MSMFIAGANQEVKYDPETKIISRDEKVRDFKHGIGYQMFEALKKYGDKLCQMEITTGETSTYRQILMRSVRTALKLQQLGVKAGDIVAICDDNNINCLITFCATVFIGAIPTSIPNTFTYDDLNAILLDIHPKIIFSYKCTDQVREIVHNNQLTPVIVIAMDSKDGYPFMDIEVAGENDFQPIKVDDPTQTVVYTLTSGSTGQVKCTELSQQCISHNIFEIKLNCMIFCSVQFTSSIYFELSTLLSGSCLTLAAIDDSCINIWKGIERYRVELIMTTPSNLIELYNELPPDMDVDCLKVLHSVGEAIPQSIIPKYVQRIPHINFCNAYGSTELGAITFCNLCDDFYKGKEETCGLILPGIKLKVVSKSNVPLDANQIGEIMVNSPSAMIRYLNKPNVFKDVDGFVHTGDLGYYDDDLCLYLIGRKSQVIKLSTGQLIYPVMIERVVNKHPDVDISIVLALPNEQGGDKELTAVCILRQGATASAAEIEEFVNGRVADYQRITKGVRFIDVMPTTYTGKPHKGKLMERILNGTL